MNHAARPLTLEEIPLIHAANPNPRTRALIWTGLATGLRVGEIIALDLYDVLDPRGRIRSELDLDSRVLNKRGRSRSIPVSPLLATVMNAYLLTRGNLAKNGALFISRQGSNRRLSRRQAMRIITDAFAAANLDGALPSHALRKTFATQIHHALDHDLAATQLALRHASPASTIAYLEDSAPRVRHAIATLYLDSFTPDLPLITT